MAKPKFVISNLSAPPAESLKWNESDYRKFLKDTRAEGFLWTNYDKPHNWAGELAVKLALSGDIAGWHQSWMTTRLRDLRLSKNVVQELALMALMPKLKNSLADIDRIEGAIEIAQPALEPEPKPIVVHPYGQYLGEKPPHWRVNYNAERLKNAGLGPLLIQPTVEWVEGLAGHSRSARITAQNILEFAIGAGADGVALDLKHLFAERAGKRFNDPLGIAICLADLHKYGGLEQVHFGVQTNLYEKSIVADLNELRAMLGYADSTQFDTMAQIDSVLPADHEYLVVSETTAADIGRVGLDWAEGQKQLITAARSNLGLAA